MKVRTAFPHIWFGSANRFGSGRVQGGKRDLTVQVQHDFSYDEEPKAILAREVKQLQNKQVTLVKVL